jgi:ABC-type Fe3+-hydroxamate transport system substrate-binding protein
VGGTKQVNIDKIRELKPDLILAEKEENTEEIVLALEKIAPVFVMEVQSIEHAYRFIKTLGILTNKVQTADQLLTSCQASFASLPHKQNLNSAYVIWRKPYMVVGATTYINDVLHMLGFQNPFGEEKGRYPAVTFEELAAANLDILMLASEPFPFQEKHIEEFQAFLPYTKILLVDGEMFWYGAKMITSGPYLEKLMKTISDHL